MMGPCRRNTAERKRLKGGDGSAGTVDVWRWTMGRQRENRPLRLTTEHPASLPASEVDDVRAAGRRARFKPSRRKVGELWRGGTRFPPKKCADHFPESRQSCYCAGKNNRWSPTP